MTSFDNPNSTATAEFETLLNQPDAEIELDRALLLIAAHERPDLDVVGELRVIDELANGCSAPTLDAVARHLFGYEGFEGNQGNYYDSDNSMLDQVLDRRLGIPITLATLAIEVGRRLGVPLAPVGMPGHFLVRDRVLNDVFIDPFHGGAVIDGEQCRRLFVSMHGRAATWDDSYLDPITKGALVYRCLNNLRALSERDGDRTRLVWVLRLMTRVPNAAPDASSKLASMLVEAARFDEAASELERLADKSPTHAEEARARAEKLRAQLN